MSQMTIGRVGGDVALDDPETVSETAGRGGRNITFEGTLLGATLADTLALRDELQATIEAGAVIPITWVEDPRIDGYYRPAGGSTRIRSLNDRGFLEFTFSAERIGTAVDLLFRSILVSTIRSNAHGVTAAEAEPFHAPPGGHRIYSGLIGNITRVSEDGDIVVWRDIADTRPTWSSTPADHLKGAARITTGGYVRAGKTIQNNSTDWTLENGLIRVSPNVANGRLDVEHYDGIAWQTKVWQIEVAGGSEFSRWDWVTILRNDPEECVIRLENQRVVGVTPAGGRDLLDLRLRRGSRFVEGRLSRSGSGTLKVRLTTAEAGTAVTPTGASSVVAVRATANDAQGDRYIVGSPIAHTQDLVNGGVSQSAVTALPFFIGAAVDGSLAQAGDTPEDLALQYLGHVAESIIPVRR